MGEGYEHNRRKEDQEFAEFMGEMREWKNTSETWRGKVDGELKAVTEFMSELRTPRTLVVWTLRAIAIAAVGGVITGVTAWIKGHLHFN